jgi:hypothetical protein
MSIGAIISLKTKNMVINKLMALLKVSLKDYIYYRLKSKRFYAQNEPFHSNLKGNSSLFVFL